MQQNIPTYPLNNLDVNETDIQDVLVLNHSIRAHRKPVTTPHRTNYFGIGIFAWPEGPHFKLTSNVFSEFFIY